MGGHFEFPLTVSNVLFYGGSEGFEALQPQSIGLLGTAVHAARIDGRAIGMDSHNVASWEELAVLVRDEGAVDLANLMNLVLIGRIERPLEILGMLFHAEGAQRSQAIGSFFNFRGVKGDIVGRAFL